MIRKFLFWVHLGLGVTAGVFIFIMAATGVVLAFERQITDFVDRDIRSVSVPNAAQPRPMNSLLETVRRAGVGELTAIVVRNAPQAAAQLSIGRGKVIYVDPYSGAILGASSSSARNFFFQAERLHRALGAPLGSNGVGHWLAAISNLLFGGLILLGVTLWLPRKWSSKAVHASIAFRSGLRGRARLWNWHNVLGIWCAAPLLVIVLTGVVMSFPWANALLFRLSGSNPLVQGRASADTRAHGRDRLVGHEPNYGPIFSDLEGLRSELANNHLEHGTRHALKRPGHGRRRHWRAAAKTRAVPLQRQYGSSPKNDNICGRQPGPKTSRVRAIWAYRRVGQIGRPSNRCNRFACRVCPRVHGPVTFGRRLITRLKRKRNPTSTPRAHIEQSLIEFHS